MDSYIFDLDGTIIVNGHPLHPSLGETIEQLQRHGQVIFASARPVRDMLPLLPARLHGCLMVGCNGSMAWKQGQCLFSHAFEPMMLNNILAFLTEHQVPYVIDGKWSFAVSAVQHPFHNYIRSLSDQETSEAALIGDGVSKILILDGEFRAKIDEFMVIHGYDIMVNHHKHDNLFDITPQRENKYLALKTLGVDFSTAVAFGNDANDFAMLNEARISVFLGAENDYPHATYYSNYDRLPAVIASVQSHINNNSALL
ncbi:HAD-IIB family hydrolase [Pseudomonas graminis]